ncbi:MAG: gliding motility protein GldN [Bacteroidota bacterium]
MKSIITSFLVGSFILLFAFNVKAQSNLLNAKTPDQVGELTEDQKEFDDDKPLDYGHVGDRDVLWSKVVWEKIDLKQKVNFPLYFPTKRTVINKNRRPLFQVLVDAIKKGADEDQDGGINQIYTTSYFDSESRLEGEDVMGRLAYISLPDAALGILEEYGVTGTEAVDELLNRFQANTLEDYPDLYPQEMLERLEPFLIPTEITPNDIKYYHVKGMWYFDKRQGEMKYRLLGIAPVGVDVKKKDDGGSEQDYVEYFWVWYPDAREALHDAKVLNSKNSAKPITFDHLLNSRRFDAVIYQTENEYGDREISEYVQDNAMMQLLEAERIKEEIRNFELDMWNY